MCCSDLENENAYNIHDCASHSPVQKILGSRVPSIKMIPSLLAFAFFALPACARHAPVFRRGPEPGGIVDPGANPACTLWHDNVDGSLACAMMLYFYDITPEQLLSWVSNQHVPNHLYTY